MDDRYEMQKNMPFSHISEKCGEWIVNYDTQLRNRGMSLEEQWDIVSKKYEIGLMWLYDIEHDDDGEECEREKLVPIFKLPNIRLKTRRWIPLGDYYITLDFNVYQEGRDSEGPLQFWNWDDDQNCFVHALHPHINMAGRPCMGNFGPLFTAAYQAANLMMITSL